MSAGEQAASKAYLYQIHSVNRHLNPLPRYHVPSNPTATAISISMAPASAFATLIRAIGVPVIFEYTPSYYSPAKRQLEIIAKAAKTKGSIQDGWAHAFVSDKFGKATTHCRKLDVHVFRGVVNPCPLWLIGIAQDVFVL